MTNSKNEERNDRIFRVLGIEVYRVTNTTRRQEAKDEEAAAPFGFGAGTAAQVERRGTWTFDRVLEAE